MNKKTAFTLAEVLITLGIIGVVAALTIQTLVKNYQKKQTVTQLKKAYTSLTQAIQLATIDHGDIQGWELGEHQSAEATVDFMNKYLVPYMKVSKNPETFSNGNWNVTRYYLNNGAGDYTEKHARFYLLDGTSITGAVFNNDTNKRVYLYFDINGDKEPNRFGSDIFYYNIDMKINKFYPSGYGKTREELVSASDRNACNIKKYGYYCGMLIMYDGWQISDDYPWR